MYTSPQDEYEARKKNLAKELSADFQAERAASSTDLTKSAVATGSWVDGVTNLLTDSVALGRDLDRFNFSRDPQVTATLERAEKMIAGDEYAPAAFIAALLELSLGNARESIVSLGKSDSDLPSHTREKAAVISALIKSVNARGYAFQGETQQAQRGRQVAREAWKAIEPRAAFWDSPKFTEKTDVGDAIKTMRTRIDGLRKSAQETFGYSNPSGKFAGMTADQIRKSATDHAAQIDTDCSATLQKIAGGKGTAQIEKIEGRIRKGVRANGVEFIEII